MESQSHQQTVLASPPSAASSPTHEFSFTISLHPESTRKTDKKAKTKTPPSFAIDLSPADDIFFHGHLLPLHLLSHLPVSPRTSTNSLDSFTLPLTELFDDQTPEKRSNNIDGDIGMINDLNQRKDNNEVKGRTKSKSFSLFFGLQKWRKRFEVREKEDKDSHKKQMKSDVSHVLKRYIRIFSPSFFLRRRRGSRNTQVPGQTYNSYSGNLGLRGKPELRGRRGECSAPASMWNSPTNSGPLVGRGAETSSNTSDSTMEELQSAIQAAIAHCKNSIAMEEKIKCL